MSQKKNIWGWCVLDKRGKILTSESEGVPFPSASLIKIPVLLHYIHSQPLPLSKVIEVGNYQKQEDGSGMLSLIDSSVSLSVADLLRLSISASDNIATNILIEQVGMEPINDTIRGLLGANSTTRVTHLLEDFETLALPCVNPTTPYEVGKMLNAINTGETEGSAFAKDALRRQQYRGRIPLHLSDMEDVEVYNKTGTLEGVLHDAAIVETPDNSYVFVILSYKQSSHRIASKRIGEFVYSLMNTIRRV